MTNASDTITTLFRHNLWANVSLFEVCAGLSDAQRREPPAIGSLVSYRYRELTAKGMPRFPVFLRVRSPGAD